ncbi:hypothetical protein AVEN_232411-1 [Araneus ventricosus]|uniref:Uncharacterized protein n=1 Tax=Araneus ventricosus TaxID=182803 RepID=A0A4Y2CU59_ARAVE|nr:hypothetical protein AVEN_232411-1 [Araneus ventricosus]
MAGTERGWRILNIDPPFIILLSRPYPDQWEDRDFEHTHAHQKRRLERKKGTSPDVNCFITSDEWKLSGALGRRYPSKAVEHLRTKDSIIILLL